MPPPVCEAQLLSEPRQCVLGGAGPRSHGAGRADSPGQWELWSGCVGAGSTPRDGARQRPAVWEEGSAGDAGRAPRPEVAHLGLFLCVRSLPNHRTTGPPREPRVGAPGGWCTGPLRGRPGFRRSPSPPRDRIRARRHGRMRGLRFPARVARCGAGSSCSFWGDPALLGGPQRSALPMLAQGLWSRLRPTAARGAPRVLSSGASH